MRDLAGRVCAITGANSGIGKETALALAARGATVMLICRNQERGAAAQREVEAQAGGGAVHLLLADLGIMAEVRRVAAELRARTDRLHVLVNNAGVLLARREVTPDGYERTFAVNHLAYVLLTHELRPLLEASAPARVVNVASTIHQLGRIRFDDLQLERGYSQLRAYAQSKLANILFTRELARRLDPARVTANCLHPGGVSTNIFQTSSAAMRALVALGRPFLLGEKSGSATSVHLAASPEVATITGEYFRRKKVARSSRAGRDPELAKRLWDVSAKLTGIAH